MPQHIIDFGVGKCLILKSNVQNAVRKPTLNNKNGVLNCNYVFSVKKTRKNKIIFIYGDKKVSPNAKTKQSGNRRSLGK